MTWILLVGVGALFMACVFSPSTRRMQEAYASFLERFPPISDEQFLRRCAPGTRPEVALGVRRILAESLGVEYEHIHPSCRLVADLGAE